jgi:hypothetical protein
MKLSLSIVFLIIALICFVLKAFGVPKNVPIDFMNLGFAFVVAAFIPW